jgi:hypothetical protein
MISVNFFKFLHFGALSSSLAALGLLAGCAGLSSQADNGNSPDGQNASAARTATPWDIASVRSAAVPESTAEAAAKEATNKAPDKVSFWQHRTFPGKVQNQFAYLQLDGRNAMGVKSSSSASMLRKVVSMEPDQLDALRFSWKVPALIADADMALSAKDDSPVRLVLAFDGDRSKLSARDRMLSELAYAITGEDMPYATLMYVWCNTREPGSVVTNPRTDRIRKLVLESGPKRLNRWLDYERDIRADYLKVFGEEPGRLIAVGIMTDTDNTKSTAQAWYGPVVLGAAAKLAER